MKKEEKPVKSLQLGQIYTIQQINSFMISQDVVILSEDIANFEENIEESVVVTKVFEAYIHGEENENNHEKRKVYIANRVV